MTKDIDESSAMENNVYEERAENLSLNELMEWTVLTDNEKKIIRKLTGPGAKLLSGPRGSGKSTLFKYAYHKIIKDKSSFPVYINFSKGLSLEPLFHTHTNATSLFRQWLLSKIIIGINETCEELCLNRAEDFKKIHFSASQIVLHQEQGVISDLDKNIAPSIIKNNISNILKINSLNRCVMLMDDAAHAFSVKQQREFFELFRELTSREIATKAAIYPGVTSFSPNFQVGHEAEEIQAWMRPDDESYLHNMHQLTQKRLPDLQKTYGTSYTEVINVVALASFGLPRGFINIISEINDSFAEKIPLKKAVLSAISSNAERTQKEFENIANKLPRFKNYVAIGLEFERSARAQVRIYNKTKNLQNKTTTIGLSENWTKEFDRVIGFMEYAGIYRKIESLSKGIKGTYQRFYIHNSLIISNNSLSLGANYKLLDIFNSLKNPTAHSLIKTQIDTLLGKDFLTNCKIALPACPVCTTPRLNEDQKFCMHCGNELRLSSIYEDLFNAPVDKLPLPAKKIAALKSDGYDTISKILSDDRHKFKKKGSGIGSVWTKNILTAAEEYVGV